MRLTFLALAGLAMGMASPVVHAADLPPAPVLDDYDEPSAAGWYLRGDISIGEQVNVRHDRDAGTTDVPPLVRSRFDRDLGFGAGVGYRLGSWLRTDLTIDHRVLPTYEGLRLGAESGFARDRADFEATTFLANAYIDLPLWNRVTPYLGAGIGVSRNRFDNAERAIVGAGGAVGPIPLPSRTQTVLAWALMGGVAIDLTAHVKLDLGYRYTHLGAVRTDLDGAAEPPLRARGVAAHEIRIGARYTFD